MEAVTTNREIVANHLAYTLLYMFLVAVSNMSEKEKDIIQRMATIIPKLDEKKQNYIIGVADGMVIANQHAGYDPTEDEEEK